MPDTDTAVADVNAPTPVPPATPPPLPTARAGSVDAYRGLVMFLMMAEVLRT